MSQLRGHLAERLIHCLAHTNAEAPRPVTRLELPLGLDHLLKGRWMKKLQPAAVLVGVRDCHKPTVILTVRSENLRAHGGQISFPGGRMDAGEDFPIGTALREAQEEIGLEPAAVEVIGYLDDYPTISKYRVTPVVGLIAEDAVVNSDSGEVSEVFEIPLSVVLEADNYEKKRLGRMGFSYYELHYKRYRVWGATAGMLYNLQSRFAEYALG